MYFFLSFNERWFVKKVGKQLLSNKLRDCVVMMFESYPYIISEIMENLNIQTDNTDIEFYRRDLEKFRNPYEKLQFMMYNRKTKQTKMVQNTPFKVIGTQTKGIGENSHFLVRKFISK